MYPLALEIFTKFFSELIRFLSASALWCAVAQIANSYFAVAQTSYVVTTPVRYVGVAAGETIVVRRWNLPTRRDEVLYREIARLRPDGSDTRLRLPTPFSKFTVASTILASRGSDGFVVTENNWWYATLAEHDGTAATTFVKSDGSRTTHVRPFTAYNIYWSLIVVPGEQPRALEVTSVGDTLLDEATIIRELDWSGERRSWRLPQVRFLRPSMTAELLPDGRIALFSNEAGLSMYLLSDESNVETIVLRNVRIRQFDTAIDDAGRIAIAAARKDEATIDATVVDIANLAKAEWYSVRHDALVMGYLREIQVVATRNGFVAAWINERDGRRIEATELGARGRRGAIVEVGQPSPRGQEVFFDMQPVHDELLFWWEDGERLVQRRLPLSLTGYAVMRDLTQRFCSRGEVNHD